MLCEKDVSERHRYISSMKGMQGAEVDLNVSLSSPRCSLVQQSFVFRRNALLTNKSHSFCGTRKAASCERVALVVHVLCSHDGVKIQNVVLLRAMQWGLQKVKIANVRKFKSFMMCSEAKGRKYALLVIP